MAAAVAAHGGGSPDSVHFKEEDVRNLTEFFPSKGRYEVIAALRLARGHTGTAAEILSSEAPQTLENLNNVRVYRVYRVYYFILLFSAAKYSHLK